MKTTTVLNSVSKEDIEEYQGEKYLTTGAADEVAPFTFNDLPNAKIDKLFISSRVKQVMPNAFYGLSVKTILFGNHVHHEAWTVTAYSAYDSSYTALNSGLSEGSPFCGCSVKEVVIPADADKKQILRSLAEAGISTAYGDVRVFTQKEYEQIQNIKLEKKLEKQAQRQNAQQAAKENA